MEIYGCKLKKTADKKADVEPHATSTSPESI